MNDTHVVKKEETARQEASAMLPPVDVVEDASGITLWADLPGVPKDQLNVRIEADTLTIEGEVRLPLAQGMEASYAEVQLPRYQRAFTLGPELDSDKATAEFRLGVLRLHIPKAEHAKPRRIEVQVG
ncbi:MAG: Hsp20/alpha crystallin family protein [Rhodocyclaceae bacterium]|nr:Hsp20/alpha crystallin family protein [Rhodocyclaceae bacterium]MBX3677469.1 Hsp20/alpha crystallin family protein [Rhodocyclaceae bacterium]MCO5099003.1 Hsp20/alpha crystallin family protein [Rhodocyclaceae bacterium]